MSCLFAVCFLQSTTTTAIPPPHTLSHTWTHTHDTHPKKHRKKGLLNAVHLGMVASLVPDGKDIDYRGLLSKVQG